MMARTRGTERAGEKQDECQSEPEWQTVGGLLPIYIVERNFFLSRGGRENSHN
jgi:hypothetical protein